VFVVVYLPMDGYVGQIIYVKGKKVEMSDVEIYLSNEMMARDV
jgi:hypothetical protein